MQDAAALRRLMADPLRESLPGVLYRHLWVHHAFDVLALPDADLLTLADDLDRHEAHGMSLRDNLGLAARSVASMRIRAAKDAADRGYWGRKRGKK